MTIDERLDAFAHNLELLSEMQLHTAEKIDKLAEAHAETEKTVNRLGRYAILIARDHETRLSALEIGDGQL
jgi:hypothetical protein